MENDEIEEIDLNNYQGDDRYIIDFNNFLIYLEENNRLNFLLPKKWRSYGNTNRYMRK